MAGAYYNEIDPFAAQWLRNLIAAGLIADGDVDERSIEDVRGDDVRGYTQCHFFAGIGGWSYALRLAGWPDDRPVWTGSCPCQPFSAARKGLGFEDPRHLLPQWLRLIRELAPPVIFGEQVASKAAVAWLDVAGAEMETADYAFGASILPASCVESPHQRDRIYFVSHSLRSDARGWNSVPRGNQGKDALGSSWWSPERVRKFDSYERLADGVSSKLAKRIMHGFGNAIVPQVAAEFIGAYLDLEA